MLHPLRSSRILTLGLAGLGTLAASASAQIVEQAPRLLLDALELESATVQELVLPWSDWRPFETHITLNGSRFRAFLEPFELRTADFKLISLGEDGARELASPTPTTYRGTLEGLPGSVIAANLFHGQLTGIILFEEDLWGIQPATEGFSWLPRAAHVVYHRSEVKQANYTCGSEAGPGLEGGGFPKAAEVAEVALELEPRFRAIWGGAAGAINQATAIMNAVDAIYQNDTNVVYQLNRIVTREAGYNSNTTQILNLMTSAWNRLAGEIRRDLAHCFVGSPSSGIIGVAWLSSVCGSQQYSVSWHTSSLATRTAVTAHEFGHSWSAGHCNGAGTCWIMCSNIGGCSGSITRFAPVSVNAINNFAATRTCLN